MASRAPASASEPRKGFIARLPIGPFASRPRLVGAILSGAVSGLAIWLSPLDIRPSTTFLLAWDVGCLWFIVGAFWIMRDQDERDMAKRAASQDDGRHFILAVVTVAAAASLAVVGAELSLAKAEHGPIKALRVAGAVGTVAFSWLLVQLIYALHYAHEFYTASDDAADDDGRRGGLCFPGDDPTPDYWDFLHFACIIGVASQTADVQFTSKSMRRTGTVHSMVAFTYNTVVLALTINLCAGLF